MKLKNYIAKQFTNIIKTLPPTAPTQKAGFHLLMNIEK